MTQTIKGLVATEQDLLPFGMRFSKECLEEMAQNGKSLPITVCFKANEVIGVVDDLKVVESGLEVTGHIFGTLSEQAKFYIVPEGEVCKHHYDEKGTKVIDMFKAFDYSVSIDPIDTRITPIQKID